MSAAIPAARLRVRLTTTISWHEPRCIMASTQAEPTAPAPITPTLMTPPNFPATPRFPGPTGRTARMSQDGPPAGDGEPGPGNVAGLVAGQQDVSRSDLSGLAGPVHGRLLAKAADLLGGHGGGNQWRPDGTGRHAVGPDSLLSQHPGQPRGEVRAAGTG